MKKLVLILFFSVFHTVFAQWEACNNGLNECDIFCITHKDNTIFAGAVEGVFVSTDNGASWSLRNNGIEGLGVGSLIFDGNILYAGTSNFIYYSTNFGINWLQLNNKITKFVTYNIGFNSNKMFACTSHGLLMSGDKFNQDYSVVQELMNNGNLYGLAFNGDNVFVSHESKGVYRSSDNGLNWINIAKSTFICIRINDNKTYLGGYGGIFTSDDNGSTWVNINKGLENTIVYDIAFADENIFCCTGKSDDGIFISKDHGNNWISINDGLGSKEVYSLMIKDELIFACTENGIYKAFLSAFGNSDVIEEEQVTNISISPNPASDYIMISLSNKELQLFYAEDKVQIFDVFGIEVMSEPIHPMTASHRMNIERLLQGVYFIRIGNEVVKFVKM